MPSHIAFLRAINLGKNRKLPMADVKSCLTAAGFTDVTTHLATGNVRLTTTLRSRARLESRLEQVLEEQSGFAVPTITFAPAEVARLYADAVALGVTAQRSYLTFLKEELPAAAVAELDAWSAPGEGVRVLGRAVYWWLDHRTQAAQFSNARPERHGTVATTRDLKVVATITQRWT